MKKLWNSNKINLIIIIVLFVAVTLVSIIKNDGENVAGTFKLTEEYITVYGPEDHYFTIWFKDIDEINLVNDFSIGEALSGGTKNAYAYGTWKNDDYDSYEVACLRKLETVIIVTTTDGKIYAFNFENKATTESFYDEFVEYVNEHK